MKFCMKMTKDEEMQQKMRNVTDHINDSINRLKERVEFFEYIEKYHIYLSKYQPLILSMHDVYSRDTVNVLSNVLDEDSQTSSLFTLQSFLKDSERNIFYRKIKSIKNSINEVVQLRGCHIGHFTTKYNSIDKGKFPLNTPLLCDSQYLDKRVKRIENIFWKMKEKLCIDGIFGIYRGGFMMSSFKELVELIPK